MCHPQKIRLVVPILSGETISRCVAAERLGPEDSAGGRFDCSREHHEDHREDVERRRRQRGVSSCLLPERERSVQVHLRIASPPVKHPCFMGINIPTREELIAPNKSIEEITDFLGADSVSYLSVEGLTRVGGRPAEWRTDSSGSTERHPPPGQLRGRPLHGLSDRQLPHPHRLLIYPF